MKHKEQLLQFAGVITGALKRQFQINKPVEDYELNWDPSRRMLNMTGKHGNLNISISVALSAGNASNVGRFARMAGGSSDSVSFINSGTYDARLFPDLHVFLTNEKKEAKAEEIKEIETAKVEEPKKKDKKSKQNNQAPVVEEVAPGTTEPVVEEPKIEEQQPVVTDAVMEERVNQVTGDAFIDNEIHE